MAPLTTPFLAVLSVPEAARLLGLHPHSVRLAIRDGRLPAHKKGNMYWIERRALEAWQATRRNGGKT